MARVFDEETPRFSDPDSLSSQVREYVNVKKSMEIMEARSKELREKLFSQIDLEGEEDHNGNFSLELDSDIEGVVRIEKQRRVTRKIDEMVAEAVIESNNLTDVYKTIQVIDEDALMAAHYEGRISEADLDSMFPAKVVWALMTKKK